MKVGFIGAGGTGKTTLAKALADKQGLEFMPSPSRDCFMRMGLKTEDDQKKLSPSDRLALQNAISNAVDNQIMETSDGVFDRTQLDTFAYTSLQCNDVIWNSAFLMQEQATLVGLGTFDFLFYAPIYDWDVVGHVDGMRTNSLAQRRLLAAFMRQFLYEHMIQVYILPDIDVASRLHFCREIMA